jgi:hypothetical protein
LAHVIKMEKKIIREKAGRFHNHWLEYCIKIVHVGLHKVVYVRDSLNLMLGGPIYMIWYLFAGRCDHNA